jgi:hypothetical protein
MYRGNSYARFSAGMDGSDQILTATMISSVKVTYFCTLFNFLA